MFINRVHSSESCYSFWIRIQYGFHAFLRTTLRALKVLYDLHALVLGAHTLALRASFGTHRIEREVMSPPIDACSLQSRSLNIPEESYAVLEHRVVCTPLLLCRVPCMYLTFTMYIPSSHVALSECI